MGKILVFLGMFFVSLTAFCDPANLLTTYLNPGVNYVVSGADVGTGGTIGSPFTTVISRNTTAGKTFYLDLISIEGWYNVASATAAKLGICSLQSPQGTTVASFNLYNSTTSPVDRIVVEPSYPIAVTSSMAITCAPTSSALSINWNANYSGFEN